MTPVKTSSQGCFWKRKYVCSIGGYENKCPVFAKSFSKLNQYGKIEKKVLFE